MMTDELSLQKFREMKPYFKKANISKEDAVGFMVSLCCGDKEKDEENCNKMIDFLKTNPDANEEEMRNEVHRIVFGDEDDEE